MEDIASNNDASFRYEVADIKAWSYLSLHLAEKLKGAIALQTYRMKGGEENKECCGATGKRIGLLG